MRKEEISSAMYRLSCHVGDPGDFDCDIWGSMFYLDSFYSDAKDGIITWDSFDLVFLDYLDNGIPVASQRVWDLNAPQKPSFLDKLKRFLKR